MSVTIRYLQVVAGGRRLARFTLARPAIRAAKIGSIMRCDKHEVLHSTRCVETDMQDSLSTTTDRLVRQTKQDQGSGRQVSLSAKETTTAYPLSGPESLVLSSL
jgi:hypothetical protein